MKLLIDCENKESHLKFPTKVFGNHQFKLIHLIEDDIEMDEEGNELVVMNLLIPITNLQQNSYQERIKQYKQTMEKIQKEKFSLSSILNYFRHFANVSTLYFDKENHSPID